ncbi:hypothetical protein [Aquisediminimonas sediminicola]|uniref:hypothetical protein n=1 Tax=Alteraquisediminimonas sediminicola TaxID=2676787 RepID=UPI001C8EA352|nr:hypothetical protein [Aquisediminimonas sediminicola]
MTADQYLASILLREQVDTGLMSPVRAVQNIIMPALITWGGEHLNAVHPSGSFAKGTANRSGTDIDLFISVAETVPNPMKEVYETLFSQMTARGYAPKRQNVSININVGGYSVDLVPGKRQNAYSSDHSLYRRRADTWTKTNVITHISRVAASGCADEIRILKLWRDQKGLDFPSFCIELAVISALSGRFGTLSERVWAAFEYLHDRFPSARIVDPANTNNIISDDLTAQDRQRIHTATVVALRSSNWDQIVK